MAGYKEILDDLHALLSANDLFRNNVSRHDFSAVANSGSTAIVLRVGGFKHDDEAFGGVYGVVWDLHIDIYESYSAHIEEDTQSLVKARDTVIDLIEKNIYLGQGSGNAHKIEFAAVNGGDSLGVVYDEDEETVTHFTLSVLINVRQQHVVTLAE